jgi:hypothetical protein
MTCGASGCSSSTVRSRLGALRELRGPAEAWLLIRVCLFGAAVPLLMRLPLPRVAALLTRAPRRGSPRRRPSPPEIIRLERLVAVAPRVGRPFVRTGCLTRGVTLFWFLRRAGLDVELRFGLDPRDGDTDGHCWLAIDGEPFLEQRDPRPRFAELYRLPLPAA